MRAKICKACKGVHRYASPELVKEWLADGFTEDGFSSEGLCKGCQIIEWSRRKELKLEYEKINKQA